MDRSPTVNLLENHPFFVQTRKIYNAMKADFKEDEDGDHRAVAYIKKHVGDIVYELTYERCLYFYQDKSKVPDWVSWPLSYLRKPCQSIQLRFIQGMPQFYMATSEWEELRSQHWLQYAVHTMDGSSVGSSSIIPPQFIDKLLEGQIISSSLGLAFRYIEDAVHRKIIEKKTVDGLDDADTTTIDGFMEFHLRDATYVMKDMGDGMSFDYSDQPIAYTSKRAAQPNNINAFPMEIYIADRCTPWGDLFWAHNIYVPPGIVLSSEKAMHPPLTKDPNQIIPPRCMKDDLTPLDFFRIEEDDVTMSDLTKSNLPEKIYGLMDVLYAASCPVTNKELIQGDMLVKPICSTLLRSFTTISSIEIAYYNWNMARQFAPLPKLWAMLKSGKCEEIDFETTRRRHVPQPIGQAGGPTAAQRR
jgi:hypothetical protein